VNLINPVSEKERLRRQFREYFVYKHNKYPEDQIEVETAIEAFLEFNKYLIQYNEALRQNSEELQATKIPVYYVKASNE
jgi:hypothetical protein